jgi:hypothetical protein
MHSVVDMTEAKFDCPIVCQLRASWNPRVLSHHLHSYEPITLPLRYSNGGGGVSLEPPVFNIAEKLEYRNGVQRWTELVATLALAGNKDAKAVSAELTDVLIASLPDEQQSLVKASEESWVRGRGLSEACLFSLEVG